MKPPARGWYFPRVVAHRGGGILAPENTLAGMREAGRRGFRGVEFDVMLAADGVPVLMHDPTFGRTVRGRGAVARTPSAQLAGMDAGSWLGSRFRGEPIPLLGEVIAWLHRAGIWMNIEIKPTPGADVRTGAVVGELTAAAWSGLEAAAGTAQPPPVFSSFSVQALRAVRTAAPAFGRAMLWQKIPSGWADVLEDLDCIAVHCDHVHLTPAMAAAVKQAGFGLMCYTVNEPGRARELLAWGVDAVCTDRLDLITPQFS